MHVCRYSWGEPLLVLYSSTWTVQYYVLLLRLLSESILKHKFTGHWHDINTLSAMLNIDIFMLECKSEDVTPMNANYFQNWTLNFEPIFASSK
jgi:hypothetical protein